MTAGSPTYFSMRFFNDFHLVQEFFRIIFCQFINTRFFLFKLLSFQHTSITTRKIKDYITKCKNTDHNTETHTSILMLL
uniref:Uncharacterized protein n=1 Tax=Octopus bimaculoides TaxID=37653 RepID=A0A0L8I2U7_OCTBM